MRVLKAISSKIAKLMEMIGLRCSDCGSFRSQISEKAQLEWGTNWGNILLMDPFYLVVRRRHCANCDRLMTSRVVSANAA